MEEMTFPRRGDQSHPLSTGSTQCVHTVQCPVCPVCPLSSVSSVSSVSRNIHPVCVRLIKRKIVPFSTSIVMGNQLRLILNVSSFLFDNLPRTAQCSQYKRFQDLKISVLSYEKITFRFNLMHGCSDE